MKKLTYLLTAIGVFGAVLNVMQMRASFVVWMVTNFGLFLLAHREGRREYTVLFAAYLFTALWGFAAWQ